ncbi:MAG: hypothetical protein LBV06_01895 [Propionibacteriaceae bacterium]|jgi:hypothetical protein|nr:hypothetical protein [Propionibacteriaceae bacterium]
MDASGPLFAILVVACLFYVVPSRLSWKIPTQGEVDQQDPLHLSMKRIHTGVPVEQTTCDATVSTLLMRRAGRRAAMRLARQAEKRRRVVFAILLTICVATIPFAVLGWMLRWWVPVAAFAVVVAWVVYSRLEARRTQKQLDAIVADTELGDDEKTVAVELNPVPLAEAVVDEPASIVGPNGDVQTSLWDPITVVPATYISAPTAARTVRTIDLAVTPAALPVTDDWVHGQSDVGSVDAASAG